VKSRHCAATSAPRFLGAGGVALALGTLILTAGALPAQAQTGGNTTPDKTVPVNKAKPKPAAVNDAKSAASYSIGISIGTQLHGLGLSAESVTYERLIQGLRDSLSGKVVGGAQDGQRVQMWIAQIRESLAQTNKAAAEKFLAENGKLPGVVTTPSGLEYKIDRPGTGESPKPNDQVTVNYRGTLLDGSEFDSSYKTNKPFTTALGNGLIKGWTEALQLMKVGEKVELFIPPELAYGQNPPAPLPPNSLLKFEVELLGVKPAPPPGAGPPPGAAMSGPQHP
jgi:FKBP-type peptidyl-prolyl cis-trans isomerase FklB